MTIYLDCNATTPIDPAVRQVVLNYLDKDFGNAGSRTHAQGVAAKRAVEAARAQVAALVAADASEVVFTSGATESNNIAILGLANHADRTGKRHIISSVIEHKAVLEPLAALADRGFEITWLPCDASGRVSPAALAAELRADTLLVSLMHVNNETGIIQPLEEYADTLRNHEAYFHTDASQSFGKLLPALRNPRIDLISISGHKIYAPKGIGALVTRRRGLQRPPLEPLQFGGGQERGLRPGTLPVMLIAGLGKAAECAGRENDIRTQRCLKIRECLLNAFSQLSPVYTGSTEWSIAHAVNFRLPGLDSEAFMVGVKAFVAISNGSACTSHSYSPSHVLRGMGMSPSEANECVRISWCHLTPDIDWEPIIRHLHLMRA